MLTDLFNSFRSTFHSTFRKTFYKTLYETSASSFNPVASLRRPALSVHFRVAAWM